MSPTGQWRRDRNGQWRNCCGRSATTSLGLATPVACEPASWLSRFLPPTPAKVNDRWIDEAKRESWTSPADVRRWIPFQQHHVPADGDSEALEILGLFLAVFEQQRTIIRPSPCFISMVATVCRQGIPTSRA